MPRVRCFTWNVCGLEIETLAPADGDALDAALADGLAGCAAAGVDVACCGVVEALDLTPANVVRDSLVAASETRMTRLAAWRQKFAAALGPDYAEAASGGLVGVALFVFAKTDVLRSCEVGAVATGLLGGALGNKGAVVARLICEGFPMTIHVVHAHMASDLEQTAQRNADYAAIVDARCVPDEADASGSTRGRSASHAAVANLGSKFMGLLRQGDGPFGFAPLGGDVVIWQGDLNYRLDDVSDLPAPGALARAWSGLSSASSDAVAPPPPPVSPEDVWRVVVAEIERGDWVALRRRDQLLKAIEAGAAFDGFEEAPLAFAPTYKLLRAPDARLEYKANRRPAWCDRILWRARREISVEGLGYRAVASGLSDHRAVVADLRWEWPKEVSFMVRSESAAAEAFGAGVDAARGRPSITPRGEAAEAAEAFGAGDV